MADAEQHQSLYRRHRPQRFSEVRGQDHVTRALQNAVRDGRVTQGYLFSGPRGTGKTSTARILAKALNCTKPDDGEPCGVCDSCVAVQAGASYDVIELDAASNNGVDAMRDLVSRAALGTPGRWKVYIVDEVHMLSTAAANTLLKTLEEPPGHVVFVLATTDPQKVLPTVRSRVQHYEFRLLSTEVLAGLVRDITAADGIALTDSDLEIVVRRGAGSGRDVLSALDQAAALGRADDDIAVADEVLEALCDRDTGRAFAAVAAGCTAGRDPRRLAEDVLAALRNAFLVTMAPKLADLAPDAEKRLDDQARRLGPAALVRAMEAVGEALADMREALDPRITLEVALVRLTRPEADASPGALLERIERLERSIASGVPDGAAPTPTATAPQGATAAPTTPSSRAIGAVRKAPATRSTPTPAPASPSDATTELPSRDELTKAWGDEVLAKLRPRARSLYTLGRWADVVDRAAVFALPNAAHRDHCEQCRPEVEKVLGEHFGRAIRVRLIVDDSKPPPPAPAGSTSLLDDDTDAITKDDLADAPNVPDSSPADRLKQAFPGAKEVE